MQIPVNLLDNFRINSRIYKKTLRQNTNTTQQQNTQIQSDKQARHQSYSLQLENIPTRHFNDIEFEIGQQPKGQTVPLFIHKSQNDQPQQICSSFQVSSNPLILNQEDINYNVNISKQQSDQSSINQKTKIIFSPVKPQIVEQKIPKFFSIDKQLSLQQQYENKLDLTQQQIQDLQFSFIHGKMSRQLQKQINEQQKIQKQCEEVIETSRQNTNNITCMLYYKLQLILVDVGDQQTLNPKQQSTVKKPYFFTNQKDYSFQNTTQQLQQLKANHNSYLLNLQNLAQECLQNDEIRTDHFNSELFQIQAQKCQQKDKIVVHENELQNYEKKLNKIFRDLSENTRKEFIQKTIKIKKQQEYLEDSRMLQSNPQKNNENSLPKQINQPVLNYTLQDLSKLPLETQELLKQLDNTDFIVSTLQSIGQNVRCSKVQQVLSPEKFDKNKDSQNNSIVQRYYRELPGEIKDEEPSNPTINIDEFRQESRDQDRILLTPITSVTSQLPNYENFKKQQFIRSQQKSRGKDSDYFNSEYTTDEAIPSTFIRTGRSKQQDDQFNQRYDNQEISISQNKLPNLLETSENKIQVGQMFRNQTNDDIKHYDINSQQQFRNDIDISLQNVIKEKLKNLDSNPNISPTSRTVFKIPNISNSSKYSFDQKVLPQLFTSVQSGQNFYPKEHQGRDIRNNQYSFGHPQNPQEYKFTNTQKMKKTRQISQNTSISRHIDPLDYQKMNDQHIPIIYNNQYFRQKAMFNDQKNYYSQGLQNMVKLDQQDIEKYQKKRNKQSSNLRINHIYSKKSQSTATKKKRIY